MSLNLIRDAWIPVRRKDGSRAVIAPWQMADDSLAFSDWPRPDLNLACLELLIGLVFLADPPEDAEDWEDRQSPAPERLRARLEPFAPAFELLGDGPRFCQDLEKLEDGKKHPSPPDTLFIDGADGSKIEKNSDLVVKRGRYPALEPAMAAMAIYTMQNHAPSGGRGNRTSMRGGGPLVTPVDPGGGLWPLVWANVPYGAPAPLDALPWVRPTRSSERGEVVTPDEAHPVEAFFGLPRRLRLVARDGAVVGVVQRPYGTNYAGWVHPLTPYYRQKPGAELLPRHPRPGLFGYHNWLGIAARRMRDEHDTARRAAMVDAWRERGMGARAEIIVAGWAMDNMKPRDFTFSRAPVIDLPPELALRMEAMVEAADEVARALRGALVPVLAGGEALEAVREAFFAATQAAFEARLAELTAVNADPAKVGEAWLGDLRAEALARFDRLAVPGLGDREPRDQERITAARRNLANTLHGYGTPGRRLFGILELEPPQQKRKSA
jgi:CRISPR system Cascade subunit CasA